MSSINGGGFTNIIGAAADAFSAQANPNGASSITGGGLSNTVGAASNFSTETDADSAASINENSVTTTDSLQTDVHLNAANSAAKKPGKIQVP